MKEGKRGGGDKMHDSFLSLLALYLLGLFALPQSSLFSIDRLV
jgi:hypothetical protein